MNFIENGLVSTLTKADQASLRSACRSTVLTSRDVLESPVNGRQAVYFLTGACVAKLVRGGNSRPVAVGITGVSGTVGLQFAFGGATSDFTMLVQGTGTAWVIEGAALRKIVAARMPMLLAIFRHVWMETQELAKYAGQLQTQTVCQRLALWIVKSQGLDKKSPLELTHEHLARMLGVRRASISAAAIELRERGLVEYSRGRLFVRDQSGLVRLSIEHR